MAAPKHLRDTRLRTARLESRPFPKVFSLSLLSVSGVNNFTAAEPLFADYFFALPAELQAVRPSFNPDYALGLVVRGKNAINTGAPSAF